jgi:hypothetical protein
MVATTRFDANLGNVKKILRDNRKLIEPHLKELHSSFVDCGVEELLEIAAAARELADFLRTHKTNKRGHIYAVLEDSAE